MRLQLAGEELRPSVPEAPVRVGVRNKGHHDIVLLDPADIQFLDELCIEVCRLLLGSLSARDPDEHKFLGTLDAEPGVLDDEVRFGVLLIDLVTIARRYSEGR